MTASELANVTGIATAAVSMMLTKMAKTGELTKARLLHSMWVRSGPDSVPEQGFGAG